MIPWLGFQNIWRRCYGSTGADAGSPRATGSTGSRFDSCPLNEILGYVQMRREGLDEAHPQRTEEVESKQWITRPSEETTLVITEKPQLFQDLGVYPRVGLSGIYRKNGRKTLLLGHS